MGVTLDVGPGQTYATIAAAEAATHDGDLVEIAAGTYHESVTWHANGLTVRGVGGRPVIDLTGMAIANGKAIFVSAGADVTFENLEFTGAAVTDQNGAGIRWEGAGTLTVRGCVFRSNEDGILGGGAQEGHPENTALVEGNEFIDNGRGNFGKTHSVYFGDAHRITFRGNWSHALYPGGSDIGHLFKSRAHENYVLYNRLTAEDTWSSYEINIPQGGDAYVIGNVIQQKLGTQRTMISFGDGDGTQYTGSVLHVVNNTFVSEATGPATYVRTTQADAQITVVNNLFVGDGTVVAGGVVAAMTNNVMGAATDLVDAAHYDYHLAHGATAEIDAAIDPGAGLAPDSEYVHPAMTVGRHVAGAALDIGAYEHGNPGGNVVDAGAGGGSSGGDGLPIDGTGSKPGGCCDSGDGSAAALAPLAFVLAARRRRRR